MHVGKKGTFTKVPMLGLGSDDRNKKTAAKFIFFGKRPSCHLTLDRCQGAGLAEFPPIDFVAARQFAGGRIDRWPSSAESFDLPATVPLDAI